MTRMAGSIASNNRKKQQISAFSVIAFLKTNAIRPPRHVYLCRRFIKTIDMMGRRQAVRHRLLMPAFAGSIPAAPAISISI
jgi:hypothetical protein